MVRNGYGAKYIWYEMVSGYGTKLQFCGTKWQWYKMVMVRNDQLRNRVHVCTKKKSKIMIFKSNGKSFLNHFKLDNEQLETVN